MCSFGAVVLMEGTHIEWSVDWQKCIRWGRNVPNSWKEGYKPRSWENKSILNRLPQDSIISRVLKGQGQYYNPMLFTNGKNINHGLHHGCNNRSSTWLENEIPTSRSFSCANTSSSRQMGTPPTSPWIWWYGNPGTTNPVDDYSGRSPFRSAQNGNCRSYCWKTPDAQLPASSLTV